MKCKVYGMLAAAPADYPHTVELRVYPQDKSTGLASGGFYPNSPHWSWEDVRTFVPLVPHAWAGIEEILERGDCAALHLGEHELNLPEGTTGPGILAVTEDS